MTLSECAFLSVKILCLGVHMFAVSLAELLFELVMTTCLLVKLRVMLKNARCVLILFGTIRGLSFSLCRLLSSSVVPDVLCVVSAYAA